MAPFAHGGKCNCGWRSSFERPVGEGAGQLSDTPEPYGLQRLSANGETVIVRACRSSATTRTTTSACFLAAPSSVRLTDR